MVVGFNLHQHVVCSGFFLVGATLLGYKTLNLMSRHDGRIVRVSHHGVLRILLVRMTDHAKQTVGLVFAINGKFGIENLVTAMFAVGLRKHHQFNIGRVATQMLKGRQQIINFIFSQSQTKFLVGFDQGVPPTL